MQQSCMWLRTFWQVGKRTLGLYRKPPGILSVEWYQRSFCTDHVPDQVKGEIEPEEFKIMELKTVVSRLNKFAQPSLAASWDNVGLLVEPSPPHEVNTLLLTNDLSEAVMSEAVERKVNMILSYHPPVFVPLKRLTQATWKERIVVKCIESRIAIYSPHTAYDALDGGVNDWLLLPFGAGKVDTIGKSVAKCYSTPGGHQVQFSSDIESVAQLVKDLKAINGITVSQRNSCEISGLPRWTLNCTDKGLSAVVACLKQHETPRTTLEILQLSKAPIPKHGEGRVLKLATPLNLEEVIGKIKTHLNLPHVRLARAVGQGEGQIVKTVAVCAGSGGTVLRGVEADVYLTGEMSHHEVLDANHRGTSVILCDHSNTERGYLKVLKEKLADLFDNKVEVLISELDKDPLTVV